MMMIIWARYLSRNSNILFHYVLASAFSILFLCANPGITNADQSGITTEADQYGPAQSAYVPPSGRGPVVIMISCISGPADFRSFAIDLAKLGYYTVLLNGNDIVENPKEGYVNLKNAIVRAQNSPYGQPGKVAVVGYSFGGRGALFHATKMPDFVSVVIAYYPAISIIANEDMNALVKEFKVPILVLSGELDKNPCCSIESMRAMESAAKANRVPLELVVYPSASHAFNLKDWPMYYRPEDAADAWGRMVNFLRKHNPLP
jgi:dienelactone hydrolase